LAETAVETFNGVGESDFITSDFLFFVLSTRYVITTSSGAISGWP
jgi:hypothetical protein